MTRDRWDFSTQLTQFGPEGTQTGDPVTLHQAQRYCRWVAHAHYENFQIASWFLPLRVRQDFMNLYAYCRWSDDCGDEAGSPERANELLAWWHGQLDRLFRGEPADHPVMRALGDTVQRHQLPAEPFYNLISAFTQDQHQLRYESHASLEDYCRRSANPVGRLVLGLGGAATDAENLRLSDHICTGLQLANFCQDMARDAVLGRIYAPRELWTAHGVDEAMLLAGRPTPPLQSLLVEWVALARGHLDAGQALCVRVPRWLARDIRLFRGGGLAILQQIEAQDYDVWTRRPRVSKFQKLRLLLSSLRVTMM